MINWLNLREEGLGFVTTWAKKRITWELKKRRGQAIEEETGPQFHDAAIESAFLESVKNYQLEPWDKQLTLFRPPLLARWQVAPGRLVDKHKHYMFPDNDWTRYAPGLDIYEVPGDHDSMVLEPNVRVLANRIRRVLEKADQTVRTQTAPHYREAAE